MKMFAIEGTTKQHGPFRSVLPAFTHQQAEADARDLLENNGIPPKDYSFTVTELT